MDKLIKTEKELYEILPEKSRKDYMIGIHGFDGDYWIEDQNGKYNIDEKKIATIKRSILENGLEFQQGRTLLSTVSFKDIENKYLATKGSYSLGGIIVALPKIIKTREGDKVFIGSPNETKIPSMDRNHAITSLSEMVLPDNDKLDSMFILATYKKNEEQTGIFVELNPNHLYTKEGFVEKEYYEHIKDKIKKIKNDIPQSVLEETLKQKENYDSSKREQPISR